MSNAEELVGMLHEGRVSPAAAVHDHGCPCTRWGKKFGPCNCPAGPIDAELTRIYKDLGLACKSCGAYKASGGSGHFMTCRYSGCKPSAKGKGS